MKSIKTLNENQLNEITRLVDELNPDQILWLSGYLQGRFGKISQNGTTDDPVAVMLQDARTNLTILYGTESGHSKTLADNLLEMTTSHNISASVISMYDYNHRKLKEEENLAIIVSTHGEGEPPDMAEEFYNYTTGKRAPKLENLKYSVLALGDRSYKYFCKTGEDIDSAFKRLGAENIFPIVKCDVDFEDDARLWMEGFLKKLTPAIPDNKMNGSPVIKSNVTEYSRNNPFLAGILEKVRITGRDSDKEVYHIELSLEGSGLTYEPGDSAGIFTKNPESLVSEIIKKTGSDPDQPVSVKTGVIPYRNALDYYLEITVLSLETIKKYYEKTGIQGVGDLLNNDDLLDDYLYGNDLLDLLEDFPFEWNATELVEILRPLPPRLYSIASSQESVGNEVHITVSVVKYKRKNRMRLGACSSHLADNISTESHIPIFIEKNSAFKLPENGSKIIMMGAGTGIAPFRGFMQHRESLGIKGNSWLIFGDRRFYSDFLYQVEWQKLLKSNNLEKMNVAFSRDQEEKIYIQHRLKENQKEIYSWLNEGAYLYLCGDMKSMAKDVNKTLLEIIQIQGEINEEQAKKYIKNLKREKRFQSDVY
jgi:sulfite reductase (NADPH) flavoprotein alpha-component